MKTTFVVEKCLVLPIQCSFIYKFPYCIYQDLNKNYMDYTSIDILQILYHTNSNQGATKNPNDKNEQEKLKKAAEDLCRATNAATSNALKKKLILRLEKAAKVAVGSAAQLILVAKAAKPNDPNPSSQQLVDNSGKVGAFILEYLKETCC